MLEGAGKSKSEDPVAITGDIEFKGLPCLFLSELPKYGLELKERDPWGEQEKES